MDAKAIMAHDRFAAEAGIRMISCSDGEAVLEVELTEAHLNANGFAQGGLIFTLGDTAFAVAANAGAGDAVSLGCTINFLRPGAGKRLRAQARIASTTKSLCCGDVTITDERERIVAKMQCTGFFVG